MVYCACTKVNKHISVKTRTSVTVKTWAYGLGFCLPGSLGLCFNSLRPRQNGLRSPDDIFKYIFFNENVYISIMISLKYVPKSLVGNMPALVQIMAWRRAGDKPLSEPIKIFTTTYRCWQPFGIVVISKPFSHCNNVLCSSTHQSAGLFRPNKISFYSSSCYDEIFWLDMAQSAIYFPKLSS